jgi:hypothetical protein
MLMVIPLTRSSTPMPWWNVRGIRLKSLWRDTPNLRTQSLLSSVCSRRHLRARQYDAVYQHRRLKSLVEQILQSRNSEKHNSVWQTPSKAGENNIYQELCIFNSIIVAKKSVIVLYYYITIFLNIKILLYYYMVILVYYYVIR